MTFGLACIHGVVGEDLGDYGLDSLTNAEDDLALPGGQLVVVVDLQFQRDADSRGRASPKFGCS